MSGDRAGAGSQLELVQVVTRDGMRLDGTLATPGGISGESPLDAMVFLHGVGGNFYGGRMFDALAGPLLKRGIASLRVNTRGHDTVTIASTHAGPRKQGAAYEIIDECRHDVVAWVDWLASRGFARVGLLGHSLGALKALYAAAKEELLSVPAIVAASPPLLSCEAFQTDPRQADFQAALHEARRLVDAGEPETLFQARFPLPLIMGARCYLDKYGPGERYNLLTFLAEIRKPTLVTYGERELQGANVAFASVNRRIQAVVSNPDLQLETVAGADHFYTDAHDRLCAAVVRWLTAL